MDATPNVSLVNSTTTETRRDFQWSSGEGNLSWSNAFGDFIVCLKNVDIPSFALGETLPDPETAARVGFTEQHLETLRALVEYDIELKEAVKNITTKVAAFNAAAKAFNLRAAADEAADEAVEK